MNTFERRRILAQLAQLGGAARTCELEATKHQLDELRRDGLVAGHGRGWLCLAEVDAALLLAVQLDGVVSCISALRSLGVQIPRRHSDIHVSIPAHRGPLRGRRLPSGAIVHREDVPRAEGTRRALSVAATARAVRCLPYDDAVAVLDQAARLYSKGQRNQFVQHVLDDVGRGNPRLAQALEVDADWAARALWETELRLVERRAGLTVAPGVDFPGLGEVDLLVEGVLVQELDGERDHKDAFVTDRTRDALALERGSISRRVPWKTYDPRREVVKVRALLEANPEALPFSSEIGEQERDLVRAMREAAMHSRFRAVGGLLLPRSARAGMLWPD